MPGHRILYMYHVSSSTVFFFVSYMHIHVYCSRLFVVVFQERIVYNLTLFIGSLNFISLPSFMFVSATVSEICENKKKKLTISFKTFPWPISTHFLTRAYVCIQFLRDPVHHKLKVIIKISLGTLIMLAKPGPSLYTQYYHTVITAFCE